MNERGWLAAFERRNRHRKGQYISRKGQCISRKGQYSRYLNCVKQLSPGLQCTYKEIYMYNNDIDNNNNGISTALNLVRQDYSNHTHPRTHTQQHSQIYNTRSTILNQVKRIIRRGLKWRRRNGSETWRVYCFGKRSILSLDLKESR